MYEKYSQLSSNKKGALALILLELIIAVYVVATLAIETGNLGYYGLFLLLAGDAVRRFINLFKKSKKKVNAKKLKLTKSKTA